MLSGCATEHCNRATGYHLRYNSLSIKCGMAIEDGMKEWPHSQTLTPYTAT